MRLDNLLRRRVVLGMAAIGLLALCNSCIMQSLHPLYTDSDAHFESGLVGHWTDSDAHQQWDFQPAADDGSPLYSVGYVDDQATAYFTGRLVELDGALLLDVAPAQTEGENTLWSLLHVPVHSFWRVELAGDELRFIMLNPDWLGEQLRSEPRAIAHAWQSSEFDGFPLLTADTAELRAWLAPLLARPECWSEPLVLHRAAPLDPALSVEQTVAFEW